MAYMIVPAKYLSLICHSMPVPLPHLISMQQPCTGYHKWASDQWAHDQGWPSPVFFNISRSFLPSCLCPGCSLNSESPSPSPHENPTQASKDRLKGHCIHCQGLPRWLSGKESTCQAGDAGDMGSIPGSERSLEGGNGNPLLFLPGKILWSDEPSRLHSMGLQSRT